MEIHKYATFVHHAVGSFRPPEFENFGLTNLELRFFFFFLIRFLIVTVAVWLLLSNYYIVLLQSVSVQNLYIFSTDYLRFATDAILLFYLIKMMLLIS